MGAAYDRPRQPQQALNAGQCWAVLAGVNAYHDPSLASLKGCVGDVTAVRRALAPGYASIRLLTDRTPRLLPTRNNILAELAAAARSAGPHDTLLFYFSGHGMAEKNVSYLLPCDARAPALSHSAVSMRDVRNLLMQSAARARVIIIDACRDGATVGKAPARMTRAFLSRVFEQAAGMAVLASCDEGQQSYAWHRARSSAFTHFLLQALGGAADFDGKGFVSVFDAMRFVSDRLPKWALEHGFAQTPVLEWKGTGDILLARLPPADAPDAPDPPARPPRRRADPLEEYRRRLVDEHKQRPQVDTQFVRIALSVSREQEGAGEPPREYNDLRKLLAEVADPAVILLGAPGCGKTTLLRRLQFDDARVRLPGDPSPGDPSPGDWPAEAGRDVSFLQPLNRYPAAAPDPAGWLAANWRKMNPRLPAFDRLAADGRLLLLLDALNELRHRDRDDLAARVARWREFLIPFTAAGNRAVLTCRSLDYTLPLSAGEALRVRRATVLPLSAPQVGEFLRRYTPRHAEGVLRKLGQSPKLFELFRTPYFLDLLVRQVEAGGEVPEGRAALFTGFARRALWREFENENWLIARGDLLDEEDLAQLNNGPWPAPHSLPECGCLIPALGRLAFGMQQSGLKGGEAQVHVGHAEAVRLLDHPRARDILRAGAQINVLDREPKTNDVQFFHQLLQEYFAARVLAGQLEATATAPALAAVEWRADRMRPGLAEALAPLPPDEPLPPPPGTGWEETARLAAAMAADPAAFVRGLAEANLALAAQCAAAPDVSPRIPPALKDALQQALIARTEDPAADLRARIAAGLALGELDDPRFERRRGARGEYLLPPLVEVPAGTYTLGDDDSPYDDEKPAHPVEVAAFQIGRFPVTNAEFKRFVDANGYEQEQWWDTPAAKAWWSGEGTSEGQKRQARQVRNVFKGMTDEEIARRFQSTLTPQQLVYAREYRDMGDEDFEAELEDMFPSGAKYRQPEYWDNPNFNNPAQPVVGICWHEARAYCNWLAAHSGLPFRLPTEAEWEAAARGSAGRPYAYGQAFDGALCNTFESHIRRATPVGVFPGGQTPEGAADLCGNVFEWTSSAYLPYPYQPTAEREDPAVEGEDLLRVVRGGAWNNDQDNARAAWRDRNNPNNRNNNCGVRLVLPILLCPFFWSGRRLPGGSPRHHTRPGSGNERRSRFPLRGEGGGIAPGMSGLRARASGPAGVCSPTIGGTGRRRRQAYTQTWAQPGGQPPVAPAPCHVPPKNPKGLHAGALAGTGQTFGVWRARARLARRGRTG